MANGNSNTNQKIGFQAEPLRFFLQVGKELFEDDFALFTFFVSADSGNTDLFKAQLQVANKKKSTNSFNATFKVPVYKSDTDISFSLKAKAAVLKDKLEYFVDKLIETNDIDVNWNDIGIFVKINDENFYPIRFEIDSENRIHIEITKFVSGKELYIGSKRQFIYHHYTA